MELSIEAVATIRHQLWLHGLRPVPVLTRDKAPQGRDWGERARQDPPEAIRLAPVPHALSTGVLADGLRAIDIDVDDPDLADQAEAVITEYLGDAPLRTRAGNPRRLLLYRAAIGAPPKRSIVSLTHTKECSCKIEVLGRGQQFLAYGTHPSGADYQWPDRELRDVEAGDLIAVTEAQIGAMFAALAPILGAIPHEPATNGKDHAEAPQAATAEDAAVLASAVRAIPDLGGDYDHWIRVGMATHAATEGSEAGLQLWDRWSSQCVEKYDPEDVAKRWASFKPSSIGAGTLFWLAKQSGWVRPAPTYFRREDGSALLGQPDKRSAAPVEFPATPLDWDKMKAVKPREWVYGHFLIRRFVSVLGAPGGTGKTAYSFAIAAAIVSASNLLDEQVHNPGKVWLYNLEDPEDELLRRTNAVLMHHKIGREAVEGRLFVDSGRDRQLIVAVLDDQGRVIATPIVDAVIAEIRRLGVVQMIVDPFIRSHALIENANDQINFALNQWSRIADEANCSILLVHHFRKGGTMGDAAAFRGASALIDAARSAVSLTPMTADEADKLGIAITERWQYIRADNAKLNLAPPPEHTIWLRLVNVPLGNASLNRPEDHVQTVERWQPPSPWEGLTMAMCVRILDQLAAGPGNGEQYTLTRRGSNNSRWAGNPIMDSSGLTEGQASQILSQWTTEKLITATRYDSQNARREVTGIAVDAVKLQEMRQQLAVSNDRNEDN